jgi:hypothetical protein
MGPSNMELGSPAFKHKDYNRSIVFRDQKSTKLSQAKQLLHEALEEGDSLVNGDILEVIKYLEYIEKRIQNPQEPMLSPKDQAIHKIQLEITKINQKFEQFLEKSQTQAQDQV